MTDNVIVDLKKMLTKCEQHGKGDSVFASILRRNIERLSKLIIHT
jgi:hypothetical protein